MAIAFQIDAFQSIDQQLKAVGGIQSAEAFGTATVGPYVPVVDVSIQSQEAVGVPRIIRLGVGGSVTGVGAIVSAQAVGEPRVVILFPSALGDLGDVVVLLTNSVLNRISPEDHSLGVANGSNAPLYVVRKSER